MGEKVPTRTRIIAALSRVRRAAGTDVKKVSISAVAREAGVSHTLIHTKFPTIAEQIREISGRTNVHKMAKYRQAMQDAEATIKRLRAELVDERLKRTSMASRLATLTLLVKTLEGEVEFLEAGATPIRKRSAKSKRDEGGEER